MNFLIRIKIHNTKDEGAHTIVQAPCFQKRSESEVAASADSLDARTVVLVRANK